LPILLVTFGKFSLVAPLANLLILPLVPLAMIFTFMAGLGAWLPGPMAGVIGAPAQALLTYMTKTAELTGGLPWAVQHWQLSALAAGGMFAGIALIAIYLWKKTGRRLRESNLVE
jgi:competence protein ComEC